MADGLLLLPAAALSSLDTGFAAASCFWRMAPPDIAALPPETRAGIPRPLSDSPCFFRPSLAERRSFAEAGCKEEDPRRQGGSEINEERGKQTITEGKRG
jgi:hypothetical protein